MKDMTFSYSRKRLFSGYDGNFCKVCPQITHDGDILVPFYFITKDNPISRVLTVRYTYDGTRFNPVEYGSPVVGNSFGARGLIEPSVTYFDGKFYLTLRSDDLSTFAVSDDGLHFFRPSAMKMGRRFRT